MEDGVSKTSQHLLMHQQQKMPGIWWKEQGYGTESSTKNISHPHPSWIGSVPPTSPFKKALLSGQPSSILSIIGDGSFNKLAMALTS